MAAIDQLIIHKIIESVGRPVKEVADELNVSEMTVRKYRPKSNQKTKKQLILEIKELPVNEISRTLMIDISYVREILEKLPKEEYFTHDPYYNF